MSVPGGARETHVRVGGTLTIGKRCRPLLSRVSRVLALALGVLVTLVGPTAAGNPEVASLLKTLDLSGYPTGTEAPDFVGRTPNGRMISLAGLRGKVVLLTFWATWCPPCREEMPAFEQLHHDFTEEGLTVLGINVRESKAAVQAYARELSLTFPLVLDPKGEVDRLYGVIGLPTTFLIGRDGRAVARAIGPRDWRTAEARALVQALLAEAEAD